MPYLLDTSVLTRYANKGDAQHALVIATIKKLSEKGEKLFITPQNLIEFRAVATRPSGVPSNGLGWTAIQAKNETTALKSVFLMLDEVPSIFSAWEVLVDATQSLGKQVHDARLAAVALAYGVPHILTFNDRHFVRFSAHGVAPVNPASI